MKPLHVSEGTRAIERLLDSADSKAVREAIGQESAKAHQKSPNHDAAMIFASGALLLREGALIEAAAELARAATSFLEAGEIEASELARCESAVADVRRGMRDLALSRRAEMDELSQNGASERSRVAALIVRGTADRVLGDSANAHRAFLEAKERAELPEQKTQALNSLGTLYVVTGALSAAKSVLEASAELCHARGDVIGEAIAMGQLGAVAMGLGDLEEARRHLSRQEWLARGVGDAFGRSRALVWLAEVALELGAPNDAVEIATRAHAVADAAGLGTFKAYADRVMGRAKCQLGENGAPFSERALEVFRAQRLPLGEALSTWDLALAQRPIDREAIQRSLFALASLALPDRVLEVLSDLREIETAPQSTDPSPFVADHGSPIARSHASTSEASRIPDVELLLMTSALSGRKAETLETQLVHEDPEGLAASVVAKTASKKNLARLAALAVDVPGLVVLALVGALDPVRALGDRSFMGALAGQVGSACLFVWSASLDVDLVARDLSALVGEGSAAVVDRVVDGRVAAPGFGGAFGARLVGVDTAPLFQKAFEPRLLLRSLTFANGVDGADGWWMALTAALTTRGLAPSHASG